ncbi:stage V sporulation protein E [Thermicanus aegyptius]|uniref:stage V sporulation protein E n=1 Tax=Thermicanus aegyptius TaxID=94009 RepID=UPI0004226CA0|nr:stage V sporulation protein E [Thermicanus aegyptius]
MKKERGMPDILIIFSTLALLLVGVVMVYSASAVIAYHEMGDYFYYVKRQILFAALGVIAMFVMMNLDYWDLRKWSRLFLLLCFFLLLVVVIPGVGLERGGARSWLGIGAFSIQPSEFAKLGIVLFISHYLSLHQKKITSFWKGILPILALSGFAFGLIMLQPDLGTGTVLMGTVLLLIFSAGARLIHLGSLALAGFVGFAALVMAAPYRIARILAFLDPWSDPLGAGYQTIQSLYAIGPGGLFGLGLGKSMQKYNYLPEPYNDFIFAILSEELGFIGGSLLLLLFILLLWRGFRTAATAPDLFGTFLATGITGMIAIQVLINIGVVTGFFPVTGITLPFISAGGSSLSIILVAIGILLNISRFTGRG